MSVSDFVSLLRQETTKTLEEYDQLLLSNIPDLAESSTSPLPQLVATTLLGVNLFHNSTNPTNNKNERATILRQKRELINVKADTTQTPHVSFYRNSKSFFDDCVARLLLLGPMNRLTTTLAKQLDAATLKRKAHLAFVSSLFTNNNNSIEKILLLDDHQHQPKQKQQQQQYPEEVKNILRSLALASLLLFSSSALETVHKIVDSHPELFQQLCQNAPKVLNGLSFEMFAAMSGNSDLLVFMLEKSKSSSSSTKNLFFCPTDLLSCAVRSGHHSCVTIVMKEFISSTKENDIFSKLKK